MLKPVWLVLLPLIPEACSFCSLPRFSSVPPNQIKTLLSARFTSFYLLTWQTHKAAEHVEQTLAMFSLFKTQSSKITVSKVMSLRPEWKEPMISGSQT